ncbi:response regulator [Aestuariispira insulae]|uniref:Response regulator receiver domain-containing protein n=1 Tax=Aestuariispira insulae TaxID=1461337 RepID=A0A3D9HVV7_9PROT|nr:response regulator [Aestuariispira insulae]RED53521.1 response regulator receiver domain-containing protein [Aestuariispira insulae]
MSKIIKGKVVVADDEMFSQSIIVRQVKEIGAELILRAADGRECVQLLENDFNNEVSLILLDINMPKMNGLQVLKMVRTGAIECERDIPVIMLTGNTDRELVSAAMALDADSFLAKPVSKASLANRIHALSEEMRTIKPADDYLSVDIGSALRLKTGNKEDKPVTGKVIKDDESVKKGRRYPRSDVPIGSIVSEPIYTSTGQVLIGEGVVINARLKRKLEELATVGENIGFIWVEED